MKEKTEQLMKPGDLRGLANAVVSRAHNNRCYLWVLLGLFLTDCESSQVSAADEPGGRAGGDPERVLLARYSISHTWFIEGKLENAGAAVQVAVAAVGAAEGAGSRAVSTEISRLLLTSLHVLYA